MVITSNNDKLYIDYSSLWIDDGTKFTIRFLDLSDQQKTRFVKRIKETAPQNKIRNVVEIVRIQEVLSLINPIIFSESLNSYYPINSQRNFNILSSYTLTGYRFNALCKELYHIICIKRQLHRSELEKIAYLSSHNWQKVTALIAAQYIERINTPIQTSSTRIEEMGIIDIEHARLTAENNGSNNIPDAMFEPEAPLIWHETMPPRNEIDLRIDASMQESQLGGQAMRAYYAVQHPRMASIEEIDQSLDTLIDDSASDTIDEANQS